MYDAEAALNPKRKKYLREHSSFMLHELFGTWTGITASNPLVINLSIGPTDKTRIIANFDMRLASRPAPESPSAAQP